MRRMSCGCSRRLPSPLPCLPVALGLDQGRWSLRWMISTLSRSAFSELRLKQDSDISAPPCCVIGVRHAVRCDMLLAGSEGSAPAMSGRSLAQRAVNRSLILWRSSPLEAGPCDRGNPGAGRPGERTDSHGRMDHLTAAPWRMRVNATLTEQPWLVRRCTAESVVRRNQASAGCHGACSGRVPPAPSASRAVGATDRAWSISGPRPEARRGQTMRTWDAKGHLFAGPPGSQNKRRGRAIERAWSIYGPSPTPRRDSAMRGWDGQIARSSRVLPRRPGGERGRRGGGAVWSHSGLSAGGVAGRDAERDVINA